MSASYKHGVLWQDHQHEQLLERISSLNKVRDTSDESGELRKSMSFLEFYVQAHFDMEKHYMLALGYPDRESHVKEHDKCTCMVTIFKKRTESGQHSSELVSELCAWFKEHILGIDAELAEFIKKHGKRL